jgi:hypothetical protein
LSNSLDYAALDQGDEQTLNQLIQEQLGRGRVRRREQARATPPSGAPQLPPGMLGSGQLLASQLLAIARKCKSDQGCWRSELQAARASRKTSPGPETQG